MLCTHVFRVRLPVTPFSPSGDNLIGGGKTLLETILTASIPAIALIVVQLIVSTKQQRIQDLKLEMMIKEVKLDIERLEKKQEQHNDLVERVVKLEMKNEAQWRYIDELKRINHID